MKKVITFFILLFAYNLTLAFQVDSSVFNHQPLWVRDLTEDINKQISRYALPGGIVGIAFKDLKTGATYSMNSDMHFNPASVIKIPVMIEAFHQIQQGRLSMDDRITLRFHNKLPGAGSLQYFKTGSEFTLRKLIETMITDSDNTATNMLIEKLGMININIYMHRLGMTHTIIKDPTLLCKTPGRFNLTTPGDMMMVMDKIYKGEVVSLQASAEMMDIMKRQHHKWGIARFLPRDVIIANKTGSLDFVRNDVGIVLGERPYIISIFCKNLPSNYYGSVLVGALSKVIYDLRKQEAGISSLVSKTNG